MGNERAMSRQLWAMSGQLWAMGAIIWHAVTTNTGHNKSHGHQYTVYGTEGRSHSP